MSNEIIIKLKTPIEYAKDGNPTEATEIVLVCPNSRQLKLYVKINSDITKAMVANSDKFSNDKAEVDKETIAAEQESMTEEQKARQAYVMMASIMDNFEDTFENCKKMLVHGCCFINDEKRTRVNAVILDKMTINDLTILVGGLIGNFLLPQAEETPS